MNNYNTVQKFLSYLKLKGVSNMSLKFYKSDITNFLKWKGDKKFNNSIVKEYLNEIRLVTPNSTINRRLSTLRSYSQFIGNNFMEGIENVGFKNNLNSDGEKTSLNKSIYNRFVKLFKKSEKAQNIIYKLLFNRPKWYKIYHTYPVANYIHIAILILFTSISGYAIYDQIFNAANKSLAFPSALERPNRFLSFQGRLTDNLGNPETAATNMVFKLYNVSSGGSSLWNSGTCSITPDQDGIFSTLLGSSCGSEIASSVFSENADIWLGVTVGSDSEATPRVQIATVAYALNSETLQGFPAGTGTSTIPYIDSTGKLAIAASSPTIESTSGTFAVKGQAMTISTADTTDGNITINPDGTGTLNLTFEGTSPGGGANGFVNATNSNITSGSLYSGTVASGATGYNFINFLSGVSPTSVFSVQNDGDIVTSGDLTLGGGNLNTGNIALTIGDGTTDALTVSTDGTGDAEVVLPNSSIGPNEVMSSGQTDEYCLTYETTGTTFEWQLCDSASATLKWNSLTNPDGNLSLSHSAYTTTMAWTATAGLDANTYNFTNNAGSATTQNAFIINNAANASASTDTTTEALLLLQQLDTSTGDSKLLSNAIKIDSAANSGITNGLNITNSAGNITTGININDTAGGTITTGISLSGTFTTGIDLGNASVANSGNYAFAGGSISDGTDEVDVNDDLAVSGVIQAGGTSATTYSRFGTSTTTHSGNISSSPDVLLQDMELDGTLFLDGGIIANTAGTTAIALSSATTTTANTLSASNWLIDNTANVGQAVLMINQTKAGDLLTASVSGTTKFAVNPNGDISAGYSGTTLPTTTSPLTIYNHGTTSVATIDSTGDATFTGGDIVGANGERIDISEATANAFTFARNDAGAVTLTSADDDATADLALVAGGTANLNIGDSGDTVTFTGVDMNFAVLDGSTINIDGDGSPTADLLQLGNGDTSATTGVDALNIAFGSSNASGDLIHLSPSYAGGATDSLTLNVFEVDAFSPTNASGTDIVNGIKFGNLTDPGATITSTAFNIGSGWDTDVNATTSLEIGIGGTNEIALTATDFSPTTSDGNALGTTSLMWSDLFLASAGVINFNNSDVTLTHGTDLLTLAGGSLTISANGNLTLSSGTGQFSQTYTGTTTDAATITAGSLTTGSALVLTGPTGATAGATDATLKLSSDIGNIGTSNGLISSTATFDGSSATGVNLYLSSSDSIVSGNTDYGIYNVIANSGAITTQTKNIYGSYTSASGTGGTTTTPTTNVYGNYVTTTASHATSVGTVNQYGMYIADGTSSTNGTSTKYGLYVSSQTGADNNYGAVFASGNVGVGTTTPLANLHVLNTFSSATAAEDYNELISTTYSVADTGLKQGLRLNTYASHTTGTQADLYGILSLTGGTGNGGTTTDATSLWTRVDVSTGHTITNAYGILVNNSSGAGTIGTQYGLYIGSLTKGSTNNYSIYSGSAKSYFGGQVGINTASPSSDSMLHIEASGNRAARFNIPTLSSGIAGVIISSNEAANTTDTLLGMASDIDGTPVVEFTVGLDGSTYVGDDLSVQTFASSGTAALCWDNSGDSLINDCSGSPTADYAEIYPTENGVDYGDIVSISDKKTQITRTQTDKNGNALDGVPQIISVLSKTSKEYQTNTIGVVSENWLDFSSTGHNSVNENDNPKPVALSGRVPVKISNNSQPIKSGDYIATSNDPGKGMKATNEGRIIGTALEDWDPNNPTDSILIFINNSWYNPDSALTDSGNLQLAETNDGSFNVVDENNNVINKIGAFAKSTIADLSAGMAKFKKVETNVISPVANSDLIIDLQPGNSETNSKIAVLGSNNEEVATIDSNGNTSFDGQIQASDIVINHDATVSGTLYANDIKSTKIDEIEELLHDVETNQDLLAQSLTWPTNTATESGEFNNIIANTIQVNNLYATGQVAFSNLFISDSITASSFNSLDSPLKIQELALSSIEIMAGKIIIDTNGNTKFLNDVEIAGDLTISNLVVASNTLEVATSSGTINSGEVNSNSVAGKAILTANSEYVRINNNKVSQNSLIYVTPITSTENKVLYVKSKGDGYFDIGFSETLGKDVEFNWWIIELK